MRPIVIYTSRYGNTQRVAEAIAAGISEASGSTPTVRTVDSLFPGDWNEYDPIVIGTPTHFGGPVRTIRRLIEEMARIPGRDHRFAFFDTSLADDAGKSTGKLEARLRTVLPRARLVASGVSFIVLGLRGPLRDGELDRAFGFGRQLATAAAEPAHAAGTPTGRAMPAGPIAPAVAVEG